MRNDKNGFNPQFYITSFTYRWIMWRSCWPSDQKLWFFKINFFYKKLETLVCVVHTQKINQGPLILSKNWMRLWVTYLSLYCPAHNAKLTHLFDRHFSRGPNYPTTLDSLNFFSCHSSNILKHIQIKHEIVPVMDHKQCKWD